MLSGGNTFNVEVRRVRPESHTVYMNSMKINEIFFIYGTHFPLPLLRAGWKKDVVNGFFLSIWCRIQ